MSILETLSSNEKVRCSLDNQDEISLAIEKISEIFETRIFILLIESIKENEQEAWIATSRDAFDLCDEVLELVKDDNNKWNPPGYIPKTWCNHLN